MASAVNSWKLLWALLGPILSVLWVDIRKALGDAWAATRALLGVCLGR